MIEEQESAASEEQQGAAPEEQQGAAPDERTVGARLRGLLPAIPRPYVVPILVAGLLFAVALAATFAILWATAGTDREEAVGLFVAEQKPRVEARARAGLALLLNYDATNIEETAEDIIDISTGNFRDQYERFVNIGFGEALEEAAASSRGQILDPPDIAFASPDEASAIARVEQTVQSSEIPEGRTIEYVMKLTLVNTRAGGWKIDRMDVLSSQTE